jgi:hypothetical protein
MAPLLVLLMFGVAATLGTLMVVWVVRQRFGPRARLIAGGAALLGLLLGGGLACGVRYRLDAATEVRGLPLPVQIHRATGPVFPRAVSLLLRLTDVTIVTVATLAPVVGGLALRQLRPPK